MIVVDDLDLLFIHVPQTGGTAIRNYLVEELGGVKAGPFHGHLDRHLDARWRGRSLQRVATIRNPLDVTVSSYFKQRTDHQGQYLSGSLGRRRAAQAGYARQQGVEFADWFGRHRRRVYAPSWLSTVRQVDHLLRFETLHADLHRALTQFGIADPPSVPVTNVTDRPPATDAYYADDEVRDRARRIFAPFMQEFGYSFPASWPTSVPVLSRAEYVVGHQLRKHLVRPGD